jgi:4-amino-4-deoxy-L-arabinose transferase-like glycosyltransferase
MTVPSSPGHRRLRAVRLAFGTSAAMGHVMSDQTKLHSSPPQTPGTELTRRAPPPGRLNLFLIAVGVGLFAIALSGIPNLLDNERRVGGYVLDAVQNGHWFIQRDITGQLASKPPLLTWIAALATLAFGEINRFALYLPSALATLGVALTLLTGGKRYFGWAACFCAGLMYLLSPAGDRQMMTARYDGLLAFPVTLTALAALRAWSLGRGWTWFWLAGALGTLAKGPLGLLLGASGLLAHFWEKRTGYQSKLRGSHWLGILLFVLICGGWFALAYDQVGHALVDKMFGRELAAHATGAGRRESMFVGFWEPPVSFLTELAPWSLLACVGFWRVWRQPAPDPEARRFERFLFCWFFAGLVLFCVAAHQRARLVVPLLPAAAWLAGRELARWFQFWSPRRLLKWSGVFAVVLLGFLAVYHHILLQRSSHAQTTLGMRDLAGRVEQSLGEHFPLVHVDTPFALQFYLNTAWPLTAGERATKLLQEDYPAYVAVGDFEFPSDLPLPHELARWPTNGLPTVRIVSNRPLPVTNSQLATIVGPLVIKLDQVNFVRMRGSEIFVRGTNQPGTVTVVNESQADQPVSIRLLSAAPGKPDTLSKRMLAPAETWRITP